MSLIIEHTFVFVKDFYSEVALQNRTGELKHLFLH